MPSSKLISVNERGYWCPSTLGFHRCPALPVYCLKHHIAHKQEYLSQSCSVSARLPPTHLGEMEATLPVLCILETNICLPVREQYRLGCHYSHAMIKVLWNNYNRQTVHQWEPDIDGLVQEGHNFIALAMELCLSCNDWSICSVFGCSQSTMDVWTLLKNICYIFTRGQFWPPGIVVACVCPLICPFVTRFVRKITHHPFKLGSQNLDHRSKRPCSRSLLL